MHSILSTLLIVIWCFLAICSILLLWKCGNVFHFLKQLCVSAVPRWIIYFQKNRNDLVPLRDRQRKTFFQFYPEGSSWDIIARSLPCKVCKVFDELRNENNRATETWVHFLCIMIWISLFSRPQSFLKEVLSKVYFYRSNNRHFTRKNYVLSCRLKAWFIITRFIINNKISKHLFVTVITNNVVLKVITHSNTSRCELADILKVNIQNITSWCLLLKLRKTCCANQDACFEKSITLLFWSQISSNRVRHMFTFQWCVPFVPTLVPIKETGFEFLWMQKCMQIWFSQLLFR